MLKALYFLLDLQEVLLSTWRSFFGEPEINVFLSSEGEEGILNWFRGNIIREIVNNRRIFVPVFQHSPVCAASRKKRSQLITERVIESLALVPAGKL